MWWRQQASECVIWSMNASCLHGDKGVLQLLLAKVVKECRLEGQDWQILRQVSPTQSHPSNGAAEEAVSTVRGLARTSSQRQNPVI